MIRIAAILAVSVIGLAASVPALANADTQGVGVVWAKDLSANTLTIGQHVYHISGKTRIYTASGRPVPMVEVPVARDARGSLQGVGGATVRYSAQDVQGRLILASVEFLTRR